jgi:SH3-like domain-containing protein
MVAEVTVSHKNLARQKSKMRMTGSRMIPLLIRVLAVVLVSGLMAPPAWAMEKGQVTNLPLPRFVSLKAAEGNVRRGPSLTHRIDWVFTRRDMPLEITAEHGHWRRVQDREGQGGWVHYSLLSGVRTVIVGEEMINLHQRPDTKSPVVAALEPDVVARLGKCEADWCQLRSGGYKGWASKEHLWGVARDELRD